MGLTALYRVFLLQCGFPSFFLSDIGFIAIPPGEQAHSMFHPFQVFWGIIREQCITLFSKLHQNGIVLLLNYRNTD